MAKTIVDPPRPVTGGVDTHLDLNVAAAVDAIGGLLGVAQFPTTSAGHAQLLSWLNGFGLVARMGVEGTSSYGTGLARRCAGRALRWSKSTAPTASPGAVRASQTRRTP